MIENDFDSLLSVLINMIYSGWGLCILILLMDIRTELRTLNKKDRENETKEK